MTEKMLINRAKKLKQLEEEKTNIEKEISKIKTEIQNEMKEAEELQAGDFLFRWTHVTSKRFDSAAFKKAMPKIYNQYVRQIASRRFTLA